MCPELVEGHQKYAFRFDARYPELVEGAALSSSKALS
jgi:hypothetical protein